MALEIGEKSKQLYKFESSQHRGEDMKGGKMT